MIDPRTFIGNKQEEDSAEDTYMEITGTFVCDQCREEVSNALLSMEEKHMMWKCSNDHVSEGTL